MIFPILLVVMAAIIHFVCKHQRLIGFTDFKPSTARILVAFAFGFIVVFGFTMFWQYPTYHKIVVIERHSQRAVADVVNISKECGRGCHFRVDYKYAVHDAAGKYSQFTGSGYVNESDSIIVKSAGNVPIAYAVDDPQQSLLNIRNSALTVALGNFVSAALFISTIFAALGGGGATIFAFLSLQERRDASTNGPKLVRLR